MRPCRFWFPRATGFVLTLIVGTTLSVRLRAELPANPLRPLPMVQVSSAAQLRADLAAAAQDTATEATPPGPPPAFLPDRVEREERVAPGNALPPSVVPPSFGQPELLPAPPGFEPVAPSPAFDPDGWDDATWQHLVHPLFDEPWFSHSDPNDPQRHRGVGQPLIGTSWRNRPLFAGAFVGGVMMNDLVPNRIYQNDTAFLGVRLGFDFDHYWGMESRWAFAHPELTLGDGTPLPDPSRDYFADVSLVHYPFGDTRWRPYLLVGLGFQTFRFNNDLGQRISEAAFQVPLGVGVKYFYAPWFTLRFDITDNLALGNARVSGMHNISLTTGGEFRFGGRRPSYFPWHNNTAYW